MVKIMIKKILNKPIIYFCVILFFYLSIISLIVFIPITQNIITNLLCSILFIFFTVINYCFIKVNYQKMSSYTNKKKIILVFIIFIIIDIFNRLVRCNLLENIILSVCLSFCTLLFSLMFLLLNSITKRKSVFISTLLYYIGIISFFIANFIVLVNLFFPIN